MANFGGALGSADFQEPASPDTTSAPPEQLPSQQSAQPSPLAVAIARSKAKKSQKPKQPATLAAAISRAKSAHQSGRKWG